MISKKLISYFECFPESCLDVVTTYSFSFQTSAEKSWWTKIYCIENCHNISIFTNECCLLYAAVDFFANKSDGGFHWMGNQYVSSLT